MYYSNETNNTDNLSSLDKWRRQRSWPSEFEFEFEFEMRKRSFMKLLLEEIRLYLGETEIRVHERKLEIPQDVKLNVDGSWPSASNGIKDTRRELTAPRPGKTSDKDSRKILMNTETYDRISELWVPDSWLLSAPENITLCH
jgi:hypothetical protein